MGLLIQAGLPPKFYLLVIAQCARESWLLGIGRALLLSLCTLKGKQNNLLNIFKTYIQLEMFFELHWLWWLHMCSLRQEQTEKNTAVTAPVVSWEKNTENTASALHWEHCTTETPSFFLLGPANTDITPICCHKPPSLFFFLPSILGPCLCSNVP